MKMLGIVLAALFPDDGRWIWTRRIAVSSAAVFQAGIVHSIFYDTDLAHCHEVLTVCMDGLALIFSILVAGKVVHARLMKGAPGADAQADGVK